MKPEEFEQAVLAGEITDFEPYLQETNNIKEKLHNEPYRLVLLKHGIEIERILELDPTLAIGVCIQEGLLPERYDEWKAMNQEWIMETFAENGYYLDELIESEYDDVRKAVIENHPDFCINQLKQGKNNQIIYDHLLDEAIPNIELFKTFLECSQTNRDDIGLSTKYQAMTKEPSTIEKTMNDVQLFESGSPLWATDLTIRQINDVLDAHNELERQEYSEFVEYLLTEVRETGYARERLTTSLPVLAVSYRWHRLEQEMRKNQ